MFLACGTSGAVLPSCLQARAIMSHLKTVHDRVRHIFYAYPGAGHSVGMLAPYELANPTVFTEQHPEADQHARDEDWPRLLHFLAAFGRTD
jgi:dienelactone hydrolase